MRSILATLALALLGPLAASGQAPPPAADLARRLQDRYDTVRDFKADFTQSHRGVVLRQARVEQGSVRVKKPGRMRWTYTSPERKELVADGSQLYWYVPADRQVIVSPLPRGDDVSTAVLFLTGHGDLTRDFDPSLAASQPEGEWRLTLKPRSPEAEFTVLTVTVDRRTLELRGLEWIDHQGATTALRFTSLRENVKPADAEFVFKIPPGVEVIR